MVKGRAVAHGFLLASAVHDVSSEAAPGLSDALRATFRDARGAADFRLSLREASRALGRPPATKESERPRLPLRAQALLVLDWSDPAYAKGLPAPRPGFRTPQGLRNWLRRLATGRHR